MSWRHYQAGQPTNVTTITEPAAEPVTAAEGLAHLHLTESSEAAEVAVVMTAARAHMEGFSGRRFIRQQVRQTLDDFPAGKAITLGASPLFPSSTSSPAPVVRYFTEGSTGQVLSSTAYLVADHQDPPRIVLKRDAEFPTVELRAAGGVEVDYWCGYSTSSTGAPAWARMATLLTGAHWFANREAVVTGTIASEVPFSAKALVQMHRSPLAQV